MQFLQRSMGGWFGPGASVRSALATGLECAAEDIRRERRTEFYPSEIWQSLAFSGLSYADMLSILMDAHDRNSEGR